MDTKQAGKQVAAFAQRHKGQIAMGAVGVAAFARAAMKRPDVAASMAQCVLARVMGDPVPDEALVRVQRFWAQEMRNFGVRPEMFTRPGR